jgi:hypothetical protein
MTARQTDSRHHAAIFGLTGAILGMLAGLVQATVGASIPEWTGAKDNPVALGGLTVVLSAIAALGASWLRAPDPLPAPRRVAVVVAFVVPAVLCFTTVGRLWYLPGAMLLVACALTLAAGDTRDLSAVVRANWTPGLVSLLGAFVVLMAVSATPLPTAAIGVAGGLAVIAAPWLSPRTKPAIIAALLTAALPFAIVTWWSIASPLVAVLALTIGLTTIRHNRPVRAQLTR